MDRFPVEKNHNHAKPPPEVILFGGFYISRKINKLIRVHLSKIPSNIHRYESCYLW